MSDDSNDTKTPAKSPCLDCDFEFFISDKDKKFYDRLGFEYPKRCFFCRRRRREKREKTGE